jgi:hypothetical protein
MITHLEWKTPFGPHWKTAYSPATDVRYSFSKEFIDGKPCVVLTTMSPERFCKARVFDTVMEATIAAEDDHAERMRAI